jgi:hypothetical protein
MDRDERPGPNEGSRSVGTHRATPRRPERWALLAAVVVLLIVGATYAIVRLVPGGPSTAASAAGSSSPYPRVTASATGSGPATSPSASARSSPATPTAASSRSRTTATSTPGAPKVAVTNPAATPTSSSRKGVGVWTFNGVDSALAQSGAGWYYTWSVGHSGIETPQGGDFVPMIWGGGSVTDKTLAQSRAASGRYLLGFNEPDMSSQANMTVDQALTLWPKLEATGRTLGSPAVAYGGATGGGWLDRFMTGAKARGLRVDFIALHWYGGDFVTADAVGQLKSYLQSVWNRYHKPIWLTEFALIDFSNGTHYPSESSQAAFLTAATRMLDGLSFVQRYAWFALPAADSGPSTGLFAAGPHVTAVGRAFEQAR